ncbi:hypothetical protein [Tersicoccus phoenicis]|uniref:hypothetical protein n=1 Tax=Tersicoccus phoenicis TaxID=554083 RepID=UPI002E257C84
MSLISMACWWCGIIIWANIVSAALRTDVPAEPDALAESEALGELGGVVLELSMPGIPDVLESLEPPLEVEAPQPATARVTVTAAAEISSDRFMVSVSFVLNVSG